MEFIDLKAQYNILRDDISKRIDAVLEHGHYIMGPEVDELEERLSAYTGARHCITVASGTEALLISLMAIGVRPGDEIITSSFSFISVAEVCVLLGTKPIFVDIDEDTCNIAADLIEQEITPRTRAIIPVSLYGQPADMDQINAVAEKHGLTVIEDAAQSFGASYKGKKSCNLSSIGCTSFFPSKPLGCYGDGGAIFTSDGELAQIMREIRVHGQSERYMHRRVGVGGRMDTLQCAITLAKLDKFDWEVQQRALISKYYQEHFEGRIRTVKSYPDRTSVFAQYTVFLEDRKRVQDYLRELKIPTAIHYPVPIPFQPAYADMCSTVRIPVASRMAEQVMSLPMGPYLDLHSVSRIAEAVIRVSRRHGD